MLDYQAAVGALQPGTLPSQMGKIKDFHDGAKKLNAEVKWTPGHSDIDGNEEADVETRATLSLLPSRQTPPSHIC